MQDLERFPHRRNSDGTVDSICPKCFRTVSTQSDENLLIRFEQEHVCVLDDTQMKNLTEVVKLRKTSNPPLTFPVKRRSVKVEDGNRKQHS